jgi:D-methionine transport system substrate-binding protein
MHRYIWLFLFSLIGCSPKADQKQIVIGTTVGDFSDQVKFSIKTILEKKGYTVKLVEFSDYVRPNLALQERSLDVNVFQHKQYLDNFSKEHKLTLKEVFQVPTPPLGIYAGKKKDLAHLIDGASFAVPNDPSNLARALVMFAELGFIKLQADVDPIRASQRDIAENVRNIKLIPLEAAQLPRSREDVDFAVINGNFALSSGIALTDALYQEKSDAYVNWGVVRAEDENKPWVKDLVKAYNSDDFKSGARKKFQGYKWPKNW